MRFALNYVLAGVSFLPLGNPPAEQPKRASSVQNDVAIAVEMSRAMTAMGPSISQRLHGTEELIEYSQQHLNDVTYIRLKDGENTLLDKIIKKTKADNHHYIILGTKNADDLQTLSLADAENLQKTNSQIQKDYGIPETPLLITSNPMFEMQAVPKIKAGKLIPGHTEMSVGALDMSWRATRWALSHEKYHELETLKPTSPDRRPATVRSAPKERSMVSYQEEEYDADKKATEYTNDKQAAFAALARSICNYKAARLPEMDRATYLLLALRDEVAHMTEKSDHPSTYDRAMTIKAQTLNPGNTK